MQPLSSKENDGHMKVHNAESSISDIDDHAEISRQLMPRVVRRSLRSFQSIKLSSLFSVKAAGSVGLATLVLIAGAYFTSDDKMGDAVLASFSTHTGLTASKLVLNGNSHLKLNEVKGLISNSLGSPMLGIDVGEINKQLVENRWIKSAVIQKVYPDTLVVDIEERKPVALWKSGDALIVIAKDGYAIDTADDQFMHLPQVVGEGANEAASQFLFAISEYPDLVKRMDAYVRVANRRWNLVLDDGPSVQLPANDWQKALSELNRLQREDQILDRQITHIDMRLPDRLVFRLPHDAAKERREKLEKALKRDWHRT